MADTTEQLRMMIEVMHTIINPVNQSLARHYEAVQVLVNVVNRLAELFTQEPTRSTIIREVKSIMDEHDDCCKDRNNVLTLDAGRKVEEILRRVSDFIDSSIEVHEKQMQDMIQTYEKEVKSLLEEQKKQIEKSLDPVGKLKDKVVWLLTAIGIGFTTMIGAFTYIHSVSGKVDQIIEVLKASGS